MRPKRPCFFCLNENTANTEFRKLSKHISKVHKREKEVVEILKQPRAIQLKHFNALKKRGIKLLNKKIFLKTGENKNFMRERQSQNEKLKVCQKCDGFFSAKTIYLHIKNCREYDITDDSEIKEAEAIPVTFLFSTPQSAEFDENVLGRLKTDDLGTLIRNDSLFHEVGKKHFYCKYSKSNKEKGNAAAQDKN